MVLKYVKNKIKGSLKYDRLNYYSDKKKFDQIPKSSYDKRFCLFPNLEWDSIISYEPTVFNNMINWIIETVDWFYNKPNYELIIRSHPAEKNNHVITQTTIKDIVNRHFKDTLPKNVCIIDSDSNITSYEVLLKSDICLVYGSKIGLEASILKKPVIICSKSHFYGKDLALEPKNKSEYFKILNENQIYNDEFYLNSLRFGYYYFFKRQFYLPLLKNEKFNFNSTDDLLNGEFINFDRFIDCFLNGKNFINEEEVIMESF